MIYVEAKIALTEQEYQLAERLLAEDNLQRDRPWDMALYLSGVASAALVRRLNELASQRADLRPPMRR